MIDRRFYAVAAPIELRRAAAEFCFEVPEGSEGVLAEPVALDGGGPAGTFGFLVGRAPPAFLDAAPAFLFRRGAPMAVGTGPVFLGTPTPKRTFLQLASALVSPRAWDDREVDAPDVDAGARVSPDAVVSAGVRVGHGTVIEPGAWIGPGVQIGRDCHIGAGASLRCALLGDGVKLLAGARVGEAGFGVHAGSTGLEDVAHFGRVILQDRVTLGANSTVDRGMLGDTVIGEATKIDNLCHVAHNVRIGRGVVMAALCGVSGSTHIGDGVRIGGAVGIADHLTIGDGASLAAGARIMRDVPAGETWGGFPSKPLRAWLREVAWLGKNASVRGRADDRRPDQ
jgi:UDP-3-O-[3-hydroxymyristoyl] glucosamine N-acyltransferase